MMSGRFRKTNQILRIEIAKKKRYCKLRTFVQFFFFRRLEL